MWSKKKRRGERHAQNNPQYNPANNPANQQQGNNEQENNEFTQCKKFLEKHPTMTVAQLAQISGPATEQLEVTAEFANIKVTDIFQSLLVRIFINY